MEEALNLQDLIETTELEMDEKVGKLRGELGTLRTGRASPQLIEGVKVEYYGAQVPLKQVASISVSEGRTLELRPWDPTALAEIEKALQKSDVGVPPQNDGKTIRLTMPALTQDRRQEMVKIVRKMGEETKVAIRNIRREFIEKVKKAEKAKELSEDDRIRQEEVAQKLTDTYTAKVDEQLAVKEKEITTI
jgi:ribosome recycling factor